MLNLRGSTRPIILNDFEPFNVEDEWECYGDIVRKWRTRLAFDSIRVRGLKKPVLPPKHKSLLIDIVLSTSKYSIILKIRTFDLYLIGYENQQGHRFEFKPKVDKHSMTSERLIPGSTFLPYGCSYGDLEGNARTLRLGFELGRQQLMVAIHNLAQEPKKVHSSKEGKKVKLVDQAYEEKRAHGLLTIVLMVPEAIRFESMLKYASSNLTWNTNTSLPYIPNLTNEWQTLCKHITNASNRDFYEFKEIILQETPKRRVIKTIEDVCEEIAIVKKED